MTRPSFKFWSPDLFRFAIVALCVMSSLALIGAVHVDRNEVRPLPRPAAKPVLPKIVKVDLPQPRVASVVRPAPGIELIRDEAEIEAPVEPERKPKPEVRVPRAKVVNMEVTAYCPCTKCCGPKASGITASGKRIDYNDGKFVAADTSLFDFGTKLVVPGYAGDRRVEVIDRGGAIKGHKLDLYFPTHEEALVWGRQKLDVTIYE